MQANRKIIGSLLLAALVTCVSVGSARAQGVGGGLRFDTPGIGTGACLARTERFGLRGSVGPLPYDYDESTFATTAGFAWALAICSPIGIRMQADSADRRACVQRPALRRSGEPGWRRNEHQRFGYSSAQLGRLDGRMAFSRKRARISASDGTTAACRIFSTSAPIWE